MNKRNVTFFALAAGLTILTLSSYNTGPALNGYDCTGAETGLGNPTGCAGGSCHGTSATAGITLAIEVDTIGGTPVTQYAPGITYTIKITGTNTTNNNLPKYGFQCGVIKGTAAAVTPVNAGTLQQVGLPGGVAYRAANPGNYVVNLIEHTTRLNPATGTGGNGTTYVQSFSWTAPASGTGSVSVWAALNAVNNDQTNSTADKWNTNHVILTEAPAAPGNPPVAALSVNNDTVCAGTCLNFTDQSTGATSWAWTFTGAAITTSALQNPANICYNTAGTYTVRLIATNANGSDTATHTIMVNALPAAPTVTAAGPNLSVPNTFSTYQWYNGATLISGATNNSYTAAVNGDYHVVVTNANGCSALSDTAVVTGLAVQNVNGSGSIALYPNPNDGAFTLSGQATPTGNSITVQVSDITGRVVKTAQLPLDNGMLNQLIKLDNAIPRGLYIVRFASGNRSYVIPFEKK